MFNNTKKILLTFLLVIPLFTTAQNASLTDVTQILGGEAGKSCSTIVCLYDITQGEFPSQCSPFVDGFLNILAFKHGHFSCSRTKKKRSGFLSICPQDEYDIGQLVSCLRP